MEEAGPRNALNTTRNASKNIPVVLRDTADVNNKAPARRRSQFDLLAVPAGQREHLVGMGASPAVRL